MSDVYIFLRILALLPFKNSALSFSDSRERHYLFFFFFFSVHLALTEELPRSESGYCLETRLLEKLLLLPKSMNSREKNYFAWLISVYQIYYLQKIT